MRIEVKMLDPRLQAWGFPHWGSQMAAGLDLHACLDVPLTLAPGDPPAMISAGIAIRIAKPDWCAIVAPRSGLGHRGLVLGNTVGILDADYEGACLMSAWNRNPPGKGETFVIQPGDRIAQLVFVPIARPDFDIVASFSTAGARQEGGFGSTGIAAIRSAGPDGREP